MPDFLRILRPFGVEGDAGWESKVTGARDDLLTADLELEYSLHYLDQKVAVGAVPRALRDITPNLDFDYAQYLSAHRNSSQPDFDLTPAIAWLNATYEVNLGVQVAVNRAVVRQRCRRLRLATGRLLRSTRAGTRMDAVSLIDQQYRQAPPRKARMRGYGIVV